MSPLLILVLKKNNSNNFQSKLWLFWSATWIDWVNLKGIFGKTPSVHFKLFLTELRIMCPLFTLAYTHLPQILILHRYSFKITVFRLIFVDIRWNFFLPIIWEVFAKKKLPLPNHHNSFITASSAPIFFQDVAT